VLILGAIIAVLLALGYIVWVLQAAAKSVCPSCHEKVLYPLFGNLRWWCPNCDTFHDSRLLSAHPGERFREIRETESRRNRKAAKKRLRARAAQADDDEPAPPSF